MKNKFTHFVCKKKKVLTLALLCSCAVSMAFGSIFANATTVNAAEETHTVTDTERITSATIAMPNTVADNFYKEVTLQKAGTTDEANRLTYSGLVPYGTGTISLGTYDMSESIGLEKPLFEILPQKAWNDTADTTTFKDKFFKVYLTSGEKQVIYYFTQSGRDDTTQAAVLVGDKDSNLGGLFYANDNSYAGDKVAAILPYLYNGTGLETGTVNPQKESYTKPTPLGFYYNSGVYYSDFIYNYTLGKNPGSAAESSSGSGLYRYTMRSDWEFTKAFTAEELKNVTVSIAFDKGTVTEDEAWVMFTSIAGKKLATDFYAIDITYETFGGVIQDSTYTQKLTSTDTGISQLPMNVTKEYYTFSHWYYETDPQNKVNEGDFTQWLYAQNGSITLNACYVPKTYEVTYDLNYTSSPTYTKGNVNISNYEKFTFTQVAFEDYPEGKIFDGWYTQATGGEKITTISALEDITVYAHWVDGYIVTFINGEVEEKISVKAGAAVAMPQVSDKTGYTFDGWYNENESYDFSEAITQNLTLTAKYTLKTFTVKFYVGGEKLEEKTISYGQTVSQLPTIPTQANGYEAGVWQYDGQPFTNETAVCEDIIVLAVYPRQSVKVTFNVDGGSEIDDITIFYGDTVDGKGLETTKEGYDFVGWQKDGQPFDFATGIKEDAQLTAVWKLKEYTISVIQNGETIATITKKNGEKITLQEVADATNITISHIYTDESLTVPYDTDGTISNDFKLYIEKDFSQNDTVFIVVISISGVILLASVAVILFVAFKRKGE